MKKEKAIQKLKNFADHAYPNEEFLMAIKALEQEPVLDKIRAEIEREQSFQRVIEEYDIATGLRYALEIIDKCMAEKEGLI